MDKQVTVPVPEDRVGEFFRMFGSWLNGEGEVGVVPREVPNMRSWSMNDIKQATEVYRLLSAPARQLFDLLMENPDRRFSGDAIAQHLSLRNGKHAVAGVLAWPGRHCYKFGHKLPIRWEEPTHDGDVSLYSMSMDDASVFLAARSEGA